MIGIDHSNASIEYREDFSFTREEQIKIMLFFRNRKVVDGCVIISTCNRMEIWISTEDGFIEHIYETLCDYKGINRDSYRHIFILRNGMEAIEHLFYLSSGLKSRIIGEDQILTQVKEALTLSREQGCTSRVLEVLFRTAIMASKKVKTQLALPRINVSIVSCVIDKLKEKGVAIQGETCMVIGNGMIGKEMANDLCKEGGDVTVTVRKHKSQPIQNPTGCKWINYEDRMQYFPKCHIVVSTTISPYYTLDKSTVVGIPLSHEMVLVDLAVPRDIEPSIGDIPEITLYNIDDFQTQDGITAFQEYEVAAREMLFIEIKKIISWHECKSMLPNIHSIATAASLDFMYRIGKTLDELPVQNKSVLANTIEKATGKALNKLLFGLYSQVNIDVFRQCIEGLEKVYQKESDL